MNKIEVIAFDADDTLWDNQNYFDEAEAHFCDLLSDYLPQEEASSQLLKTEIEDLPYYGYGVKAFTLSMVKTALRVSQNRIDAQTIEQIIAIGTNLIQKPVQLLDGVQEVLTSLHHKYKLVVATKGDLLDQERKVKQSGLSQYFDHVEIMSDKQSQDYQKLILNIGCPSDKFLMVGNSIKSDILPVIQIGGKAAYVPYRSTWEYEVVSDKVDQSTYITIPSITNLLTHLNL